MKNLINRHNIYLLRNQALGFVIGMGLAILIGKGVGKWRKI